MRKRGEFGRGKKKTERRVEVQKRGDVEDADSIALLLTLTSSSAFSSVSAVTEVHRSVFEPLATTTSASSGRAKGGRGGGDDEEEACGGGAADDVAAGADDDEGCCSAIATILLLFRAFREALSADEATELPASRERGDAEAGEDASLPRLDLSGEDVDDAAAAAASDVEQPRPLLLLEPAAAASGQRACIL